MAQFKYKAKNAMGRVVTGTVSANSKESVKDILAKQRLKPMQIIATKLDEPDHEKKSFLSRFLYKDKKGNWNVRLGEGKATDKDLIIFTKQFATMISSGVSVTMSLGSLAIQQRVQGFADIIEKVRYAVENGAKLSDAIEAFPDTFDNLYTSMVRAGEKSGSLDNILFKLTTYIEKSAKIKGQVKSAMFYPVMVVTVAVVVISLLLLFVVPTFAQQYTDAGKELPELTAFVIGISNFMSSEWHIIFGTLGGVIFLLKRYIKTEQGRVWFDALLLKAPGFGELFKKIAVGRFCSTMSTMLSSGVNILDALNICASSSGNKIIEGFVLKVRDRIEQGAFMSDSLADGDLFPQMVISMVTVGEKTGALDQMLGKVSEFYEDEVDVAVKTLLSMIEPFMIVVIGSIVGFIVIAMYLPVFDMGSLVGG